jgi:hypothetical protein
MRVINGIFALSFSVVCPTLGAFLPISTRNEDSPLRSRDEQRRECVQPASTVELHYMEGVLVLKLSAVFCLLIEVI